MSSKAPPIRTTLALRCSRAIGKCVCYFRGCRYHYPGGCYESWCAYSCVRCGELDQPLESLSFAPVEGDEAYSYSDDWRYSDPETEAAAEDEHRRARRWFSRLPWPVWL